MKKLFHLLFSLFLGYQSYSLFSQLTRLGALENSSPLNHLYAFLLNLFVLGAIAFVGFSFSLYKSLPKNYYKIYNPTFLKNAYRMLGVQYFRSFLMLFFWGRKNNRKRFFSGSRSGIKSLIIETKRSEFGHLVAFICLLMMCFYFFYHDQFKLAILTSILNIIGNFYPVVLQRHHRMRIERIFLK